MNVSRNVLMLWRVELFGKLLLKRLVLAFRVPNQRSMRLRMPNVTCRHFRPKLLNASGYHGPLSTRISGLLLQASSTRFRNVSACMMLRCHEMRHANTSLVFTSTAAQTKNCFPLIFSLVSSTATRFLRFLSGFGNAVFNRLNHRRTDSWLKRA